MNNRLYISIFFISTLLCSCNFDKPTLIPEEELGDMIGEIVLTESYVKNAMKPNRRAKDTIDYYNPILDKYGYTIEDVEYSIDKYSRRKTDVIWNTVDKANKKVSLIQKIYKEDFAKRQKWIKYVDQETADTLFSYPDTIFVKKFKDIKDFIPPIEIEREGSFIIRYDYKTKDEEKPDNRYMMFHFYDTLSNKKITRYTSWISRSRSYDKRKTFIKTLVVKDLHKKNRLEIYLAGHNFTQKQKKNKKRKEKDININIWNIKVVFKPRFKDVETEVFLRDVPVNFIYDFNNIYTDKINRTLVTPFNLEAMGVKADTLVYKDKEKENWVNILEQKHYGKIRKQ
ncbi:MAG: DUF4296 domain-containing protein [Bacteroidetes bacterium]|nr:DUF4296 domain-containing protein [Bacteroidota bacterium]